ncbi:MAG: ECF transporter S component [Lachnospiraceae bacterium]|nr:ECF transporter S component [Candidatus Colinaster equi]
MKKVNTKSLTYAAALLAICIISQIFKNMSVYITGPIINACLIICVLTAGLWAAIAISVITPITSFFITGSPIIAAIPLIMPCIMIGNILLVVAVYFLKDKPNRKIGFTISIVIGAILKGLFMGIVIALIIIPALLPEAMLPKINVFQTTFSITQFITALIGGALAYIINIPLSKFLKNEDV